MGNWINFKDGLTTELNKKKKGRQRNGSGMSSFDSPKISLECFKKKGMIGSGTVSDVYLVEKVGNPPQFAVLI